MTIYIGSMSDAEAAAVTAPAQDAGLGALRTDRGNLPLDRIDLRADIVGLTGQVRLTQDFVNSYDTALEATYVFPLPDRAAVTGMSMTADGRTVQAELKERAQARQAYDQAVAAGQRASIAEEERPDVFTMRVGNIVPGERVTVTLSLVCPLPYADGEATFRFPLVVAPRYIPGSPLSGDAVGSGYADDTDAVPDASRITPPVLLPGFPNPVRLSIDVGLDPAGLELTEVRSSLHAVTTQEGRVRVHPGERANRDFVLRLRYAAAETTNALLLAADEGSDEGTYQVTVLPPAQAGPARPRDVVLVLDRSGSMGGWKMVAARRAAARIVDTLTSGDRFAVLSFDNRIEHPDGLAPGLTEANDRHRFRAVEHLARVEARGGTELLAPLREALRLLATSGERDAVVVLVTDGQVGNEDQIIEELAADLRRVRVHTVGIDQAVNAGFLTRLSAAGGGRCELVESEDRLDEAMDAIHRRIGAPLLTDLRLVVDGLTPVEDTVAPVRIPDLFPGVPLMLAGRYREGATDPAATDSPATDPGTDPADGAGTGSVTLHGTTRDGQAWSAVIAGRRLAAPAVTAQWARVHLRDLEDRYVAGETRPDLERRIVATSLRFGVLCRFTAFVAVDIRVVTEGGEPHRVVQPVESPAGWEMFAGPPAPATTVGMRMAMMAVPASPAAPAPPVTPAPPVGPARFPGSPQPVWADTAQALPGPFGGSRQLRRRAGGGGGGGGGRSYQPTPGGPVTPPDLGWARHLVKDEALQLRTGASGLAGYERRDVLADLASRLRAMLRHVDGRGGPEAAYAQLRELAEAIEAGGDVDALWERTLRVLDAFAGELPPGQPEGSRRPFWKRG